MNEIFAYFLTYRFFFYILVVTLYLGLQLFPKLPQTLFSLLLTALNLISCTILLFEIQFLGNVSETDSVSLLLGFFSILFGSMNLVGGFFLIEKQSKIFKNLNK